jgi:hypothetical protein
MRALGEECAQVLFRTNRQQDFIVQKPYKNVDDAAVLDILGQAESITYRK